MYDAVKLFALALDGTIRQGGSVLDADAVLANIRSTPVSGVTGQFNVNAEGQRAGAWSIFNPRLQSDGSLAFPSAFSHSAATGDFTRISSTSVVYGGGRTTPTRGYHPPEVPNVLQVRDGGSMPSLCL